jgi:hypothetical protein
MALESQARALQRTGATVHVRQGAFRCRTLCPRRWVSCAAPLCDACARGEPAIAAVGPIGHLESRETLHAALADAGTRFIILQCSCGDVVSGSRPVLKGDGHIFVIPKCRTMRTGRRFAAIAEFLVHWEPTWAVDELTRAFSPPAALSARDQTTRPTRFSCSRVR